MAICDLSLLLFKLNGGVEEISLVRVKTVKETSTCYEFVQNFVICVLLL